MTTYKIIQTITNNLVRARDLNDHEVILAGRGIGFGKRANDLVSSARVENMFSLVSEEERKQFSQLLRTTSPKLIELANDMIRLIQSRIDKPFNEHIHVALTDHIAFLVRRCKMGLPIESPFALETSTLYPKEYEIAKEVVKKLSDELELRIPVGEASFITMHIISAVHGESLRNLQETNRLITKLVSILEEKLGEEIEKTSLNYVRLVTHIRFIIERLRRGEVLDAPEDMIQYVRSSYPQCYYLAWTLLRAMQLDLKQDIGDAEIFYLSMHIYRYIQHKEE